MMCFVTKKNNERVAGKKGFRSRAGPRERENGKKDTRTIRHNPEPPCFILSSTTCCAAHLHVIYLPFLHSTRLLNCPQGNFHVSSLRSTPAISSKPRLVLLPSQAWPASAQTKAITVSTLLTSFLTTKS